MSCIPLDKDNPLMLPEYSFTIQYTDHSEIYLKQMVFQKQKNVSKRSVYHVVDNTADFEQSYQGISKPASKLITHSYDISNVCLKNS